MQQLVEEKRKKKEEIEEEKSQNQEALQLTVEQEREQKEEVIEKIPQPLVIRVRTKDMSMKPYEPKPDKGIITLESKKEIEFRKAKPKKEKRIRFEKVAPTFYSVRINEKAITIQTKNFLFKPESWPKVPKIAEVESGKKILERLEKKDRTQVEPVITAVEGEIPEELEIPNFFELLLGKGSWKISEEKPICIIVEETKERYEELIAILCRDIFREKIGGKPTPIYRETIEELKQEFESLVERKIIVVKKAEKSSENLIEILNGFFSQDLGFLILVTPEPLKLEEEIRKRGEQSANIITVNPQLEMEIIRDELLKIVRGKAFTIQAESFGEEFKRSTENLEEELIRKYLNFEAPDELKYDWDRLVASSSDGDEDASPLHSAMKAFVWMYEWKKHEKRITPKLEAIGGEDVKVEEEGKNYEIETLFDARNVRGKLTKKIKKYKDRKREKVYFVLRNLDILRNLPLFLSFKRDWRKAGYNVEFFGLDLDKEKLIPLDEFVKLIKILQAQEYTQFQEG